MKAGKSMVKYANTFGIPVDEVTRWVYGYVNGPWSDNEKPYIEDNKPDRIKSIKEYIENELYDTLTGRIQGELLRERMRADPIRVDSDTCPF